jgi:hypothetical protein
MKHDEMAGHVASKKRNAYRVLNGKPEGCRLED